MKKFHFLLALFSCSASASGLDKAQPSETSSISDPLTKEFSRLIITPPVAAEDDLARTCRLAKDYNLRELDDALKFLIDGKGVAVAEASLVLLSSPLFRGLTEDTLNEAVWSGCHHFLRCLQSKMFKTLPLVPYANESNPLKQLDKKMLHFILAHSYKKKSWYEPLLWKEWLDEMDWVKFWEVIFDVDNVELFKDLVTQKLPLPFNRHVNLEKSKLHDFVYGYAANKIGAYLGISECEKAIIHDEDGRLDLNLLKWDESGEPLFFMRAVIVVAFLSNDFDFLKRFKSTYPEKFPRDEIIIDAIYHARLDIFHWLYSESPNPEEILKEFLPGLSIARPDRLEERRKFLHWIFERLPKEWNLNMATIEDLYPDLLVEVLELYPSFSPRQEGFFGSPCYGLLKWALKHKPDWIQVNVHLFSVAKRESDLDLFGFAYRNYKENEMILGLDMTITAYEMGCIDLISDYIVPRLAPTQRELLAAAKKGHVKLLEALAEKGYKIDFTDRMTLIEIANSNHIHVMKYIHETYPEIFKEKFNINAFLSYCDSNYQKFEMIKYLYELFTPGNIRRPPCFNRLREMIACKAVSTFEFILDTHPTIFESIIEENQRYLYEDIKAMILNVLDGNKNRKIVEFLMSQAQDKLEWDTYDLCHIAKYGTFYLLDMIYKDHSGDESLWNPLQHVRELAYLQWYHFRLGDLPWEDLAFDSAKGGHLASLHWILTKRPDVLDAVNQRLKDNGIPLDRLSSDILALLDGNIDAVYYTPENAALIEDEVSLYCKECEL